MVAVAVLLLIAAVYIWGRDSARSDEPKSALSRERRTLDDLIRDGQGIRERIVQERLSDDDALEAEAAWSQRITPMLAEHFPAYVDAFRLAEGDPEHFGGQALAVRTINVKLEVLRQAHRDVG